MKNAGKIPPFFSPPLPLLILFSVFTATWTLESQCKCPGVPLTPPTGFIKSNQMCALLIPPPCNREKNSNISLYVCEFIISLHCMSISPGCEPLATEPAVL